MTKASCPNCASTNTCRIVYGMVAFDEKLNADLEAGRVHLAGCGISDDAPNRHCNDCETDFDPKAPPAHHVKYKAVLFDMDGVIIDSESLHEAAFRATLGTHGRELTGDHYKQYFLGKTDRDGLELYFQFMNEQVDMAKLANEKAVKYLQIASDQITAYAGVVPLITSLSAQVPLALVTGSLRVEADTALAALGIRHCFTVIVSAEDVVAGKPNPEGYLKAAALLGIAAKDCVVVEDSASGVKAARAAGADCIAVTNTHTEHDLKEATTVVHHLSFELF